MKPAAWKEYLSQRPDRSNQFWRGREWRKTTDAKILFKRLKYMSGVPGASKSRMIQYLLGIKREQS